MYYEKNCKSIIEIAEMPRNFKVHSKVQNIYRPGFRLGNCLSVRRPSSPKLLVRNWKAEPDSVRPASCRLEHF